MAKKDITKKMRWKLILDIIREQDVANIEELRQILHERHVDVTEGTLSKDVKALHLVTVLKVARRVEASDVKDMDNGITINIPSSYSLNKQVRHHTIIDLIFRNGPMTQVDLVRALNDLGIEVRQATVSRDLAEIRSYVPDGVDLFKSVRPRISDDIRSDMVRLHGEGMSVFDIGDLYSVSAASVTRIVNTAGKSQ